LRVAKVLLGEDFVADQSHPDIDQADGRLERARHPWEGLDRGHEDVRVKQDGARG